MALVAAATAKRSARKHFSRNSQLASQGKSLRRTVINLCKKNFCCAFSILQTANEETTPKGLIDNLADYGLHTYLRASLVIVIMVSLQDYSTYRH